MGANKEQNSFVGNIIEKGKAILRLEADSEEDLIKYEAGRMFFYLSITYSLKNQNAIIEGLLKKTIEERQNERKEIEKSLSSLSNALNTLDFKNAIEKEE